MKAALYMGQKQIEMTELPDPVCGEDDIEKSRYGGRIFRICIST